MLSAGLATARRFSSEPDGIKDAARGTIGPEFCGSQLLIWAKCVTTDSSVYEEPYPSSYRLHIPVRLQRSPV